MAYTIEDRLGYLYDLAPHHYTSLPYHNFDGHVLDGINTFHTLWDYLAERNVSIRRAVGEAALLLHDAGYHENSSDRFETKEEYSAHIAGTVLNTLDVCEPDIELVQDTILSTNYTVRPVTNLQKAVRVADLGNVYGDSYIDFVKNFLLFQKEAIVMRRPLAETFSQQRHASLEFLGRYVVPITFTDVDGSEVDLPTTMNFAERNIKDLSMASLAAIRKVPGAKHFLPDQWK